MEKYLNNWRVIKCIAQIIQEWSITDNVENKHSRAMMMTLKGLAERLKMQAKKKNRKNFLVLFLGS